MKRVLLVLGVLLASLCGNAANFPFPTTATYAGGIKASLNQTTLQERYTSWLGTYYEESTDHTLARIKFDDLTKTVSEGIGYGMLIFVQMDNSTNNTQAKFDKLWAYYKKYRNSNQVMNWKIDGFNSPTGDGYNGATDAELDVALALVLAHYQWGSAGTVNYIKDAEDLIDAIYVHEVTDNLLRPGDAWNDVKNPCYFSMASLKAFSVVQDKVGFTKKHDWNSVITASYTFLQKAQHSTSGLYPDWCNADGTQSGKSYDYGYDACRTPWRIVWDYLWWGNTTAQTMSGITASWASKINPGSVVDGYKRDGTSTGQWNNSCFVGGLGCAFMCDSKYQSNLDSYYSALMNKSGEKYYNATIQIIYSLLMSGNTVNPLASKSAAVFSAAETSTDGTKIIVTASKQLSAIVSGEASKFAVTVNGTAVTVSSAAINSSDKTQIILTLSSAIAAGNKVYVTYSGTGVTDVDAFSLQTFTAQTVSNRVPGGNTVISDFIKGSVTITGTKWFSFNDNADKGASTVSPLPFHATAGGYGNVDSAASITYTLNKANLGWDPLVGMGFAFSSPEAAYDLTGSTGITFKYKGSASSFEVNLSTITNSQNFSFAVPASSSWTTVTINWNNSQFKQPDWGTSNKYVTWDASKVVKMQWKVQGSTGQTGDVWVDDVTINNFTITGPSLNTATLQATITSANTLFSSTTGGTAPGTYPASARTDLSNAITAAGNVVTTATTQTEINTANTTLLAAIATYKSKIIKPDFTVLNQKISDATTLLGSATEGTAAGQYQSGSKATYQTAINTAKAALTATTQAEVESAISKLDAATTVFNSKKNPATTTPDYSELNTKISEAETLLGSAVEGTAAGQYQSGSKAIYQTAINTAIAARTATTQAEVTLAIGDLATATTEFNSKKNGTTALCCELSAKTVTYPNPFIDYVIIETQSDIESVSVVSIDGKLCNTTTKLNGTSVTIDVANLPAGEYSLKVYFVNGAQIIKTIVK